MHSSLSPVIVIFAASVAGMLAILALLPRKHNSYKAIGTVIGAAALGGPLGDESGHAFMFYYIFSALGIVSAVRVITHTKPVYSALWFVMVVLSTSGLLLTLGSEFMAFAMIIIYGGAILVTYVFVRHPRTPCRRLRRIPPPGCSSHRLFLSDDPQYARRSRFRSTDHPRRRDSSSRPG
jgi:NADH-quinone oxidoreductase subunit J